MVNMGGLIPVTVRLKDSTLHKMLMTSGNLVSLKSPDFFGSPEDFVHKHRSEDGFCAPFQSGLIVIDFLNNLTVSHNSNTDLFSMTFEEIDNSKLSRQHLKGFYESGLVTKFAEPNISIKRGLELVPENDIDLDDYDFHGFDVFPIGKLGKDWTEINEALIARFNEERSRLKTGVDIEVLMKRYSELYDFTDTKFFIDLPFKKLVDCSDIADYDAWQMTRRMIENQLNIELTDTELEIWNTFTIR